MLPEELVNSLTNTYRIRTRAKLQEEALPSPWSTWFMLPVPGYIEAACYGPVPRGAIEWIELDPVEQRAIGRLVPPQVLDHTAAVLQQFASANIAVEWIEGRIRVML